MHSSWQWRRAVESPWFYAAWFCLFGAALLVVAHPKYGERQAGIERRFQARSQTQIESPNEERAPAGVSDPPAYSSPDDTVIPLWPLAVFLMVLAGLAAVLSIRAGYLKDQ